jgi:sulfoxide reductase heme-binding subunit YedZ
MAGRYEGGAVTNEMLWAVGRGTGIMALVFLSMSVAIGIATRSGRQLLALPRFAISDVHRFVALAGTLFVAMHVGLLFLDPYAQLKAVDFVVPFLGAYRPLCQGLGTLAVDVLFVLIMTSLLRRRIGVRAFRVLHWSTYALWPLAFGHAVSNGTDAGHAWFLLIAGGCALIVIAALVWRTRPDYTEYPELQTVSQS